MLELSWLYRKFLRLIGYLPETPEEFWQADREAKAKADRDLAIAYFMRDIAVACTSDSGVYSCYAHRDPHPVLRGARRFADVIAILDQSRLRKIEFSKTDEYSSLVVCMHYKGIKHSFTASIRNDGVTCLDVTTNDGVVVTRCVGKLGSRKIIDLVLKSVSPVSR